MTRRAIVHSISDYIYVTARVPCQIDALCSMEGDLEQNEEKDDSKNLCDSLEF
jgi:hypothetical protein